MQESLALAKEADLSKSSETASTDMIEVQLKTNLSAQPKQTTNWDEASTIDSSVKLSAEKEP